MPTNPHETNNTMIHFIFTQTGQSNTGLRMNIRDGDYANPQADNHGTFLPQINSHEMWAPTYTTAHNHWNLMTHLDEWLCIEFKFVMTATTSSVYTYINGVLEFSSSYEETYNYSADGSMDNIIISGYTNPPDFGAYAALFYIDDVVVADEYIGPNITGNIVGKRGDQCKKLLGSYTDLYSTFCGSSIRGN